MRFQRVNPAVFWHRPAHKFSCIHITPALIKGTWWLADYTGFFPVPPAWFFWNPTKCLITRTNNFADFDFLPRANINAILIDMTFPILRAIRYYAIS
jgi:hypothetical protein